MAKPMKEFEVVMSSETPRLWLERYGERVSPVFYNERGDEWSLLDLLGWAVTVMPNACEVIRAQIADFRNPTESDNYPPEEELWAQVVSLENLVLDYNPHDGDWKKNIISILEQMIKFVRSLPN